MKNQAGMKGPLVELLMVNGSVSLLLDQRLKSTAHAYPSLTTNCTMCFSALLESLRELGLVSVC